MSKIPLFFKAKEQLSTKEKIGQFFMPAAFINDTEEEIKFIENLITEHHIGGLCFFHSRASAATNFEGKKKVVYNENSLDVLKRLISRYQKAAKYPLIIAIDAEWGLAMRVEKTTKYPYALTLGAIKNNENLLFEVGKAIAQDCKLAGIHWNLSPVVDININPNNPVISYRSFGEDRNSVTDKASAFIEGTKSEGILTCIKHFPGHGDTATDSHLGLPVIEKTKEELLQTELYPFMQLIKEGVDSVMVGHLAVPALSGGKKESASISKLIIEGVLRNEMGFDGVVITDALNMHSVSKHFPEKGTLEWTAFDAGNDILCFAENVKEGIEVILQNATATRIEKSFQRIWELKEKAFEFESLVEVDLIKPKVLLPILANLSLTLFKGNEKDIEQFRNEGYNIVTHGKQIENSFSKHIDNSSENNENLVLSIFPPSIKPKDNFGFSMDELENINQLLQTKNVVLYLFGNPYFLNCIAVEKAKAIVLAYEDMEVFQKNAANHFLGKTKPKGCIPITLNK